MSVLILNKLLLLHEQFRTKTQTKNQDSEQIDDLNYTPFDKEDERSKMHQLFNNNMT